MRPIAAMEQCFQTKKVSFQCFFCLVFERSTSQTILILNSHSSLLFFFKTVFQKKRSDRHNLASISLAVIERQLVSAKDHHGRQPSLVAAEVTFP